MSKSGPVLPALRTDWDPSGWEPQTPRGQRGLEPEIFIMQWICSICNIKVKHFDIEIFSSWPWVPWWSVYSWWPPPRCWPTPCWWWARTPAPERIVKHWVVEYCRIHVVRDFTGQWVREFCPLTYTTRDKRADDLKRFSGKSADFKRFLCPGY